MEEIITFVKDFDALFSSVAFLVAISFLWKDNKELRQQAREDLKKERELFIKEIKEEREEAQTRQDKRDELHSQDNKETQALLLKALNNNSDIMKEGKLAIQKSAETTIKGISVLERLATKKTA
jgi:uncharacterized membrane protein YhiD involved in acid resistance